MVTPVDSPALTDTDAPAPGRTRRNRGSEVVRSALVNSAIAEFSAHGFEGASTRRIAEGADEPVVPLRWIRSTRSDSPMSNRPCPAR